LDFLKLSGRTLQEQSEEFVFNTKQNPNSAQESLIVFIDFQKERIRRGEIEESTFTNYYKAAKLFSVINDIILNWEKNIPWLTAGKESI
jgi:hypothetical protein